MDKGLIYALAFGGDGTGGGGGGQTPTIEVISRQVTFDSEYISESNSIGRVYTTGLGMLSLEIGVQLAKNVPAGTLIEGKFSEIPEFTDKFNKTFGVLDVLFGCIGSGIAEDGTPFMVRVASQTLFLYFPVAMKYQRKDDVGDLIPNRSFAWFTV